MFMALLPSLNFTKYETIPQNSRIFKNYRTTFVLYAWPLKSISWIISPVNGHFSTNESSRSATPDTYNAATTSTATSTPSHTSRLKVMAKANGNKKRSKSTSPSRKIVSSVAKQKDMFKQIQQKADRVDWILHPKKS